MIILSLTYITYYYNFLSLQKSNQSSLRIPTAMLSLYNKLLETKPEIKTFPQEFLNKLLKRGFQMSDHSFTALASNKSPFTIFLVIRIQTNSKFFNHLRLFHLEATAFFSECLKKHHLSKYENVWLRSKQLNYQKIYWNIFITMKWLLVQEISVLNSVSSWA